MPIPAVYERMFDGNVRIEAAWPFPVSEPSEELAEAFEYHDDRMPAAIAALYEKWREEERDELFAGRGWTFTEAFNELCGEACRKGVSGWLGIAATPVFKPHSDRNGASFSWGYYKTQLLFAETGQQLLERSVEWAEAEYAKDMAKAAV